MSYAIVRESVTEDQAIKIRSMLCLTPEVSGKKYGKGVVSEPVLFYHLKDGILHLPYLFSAQLFNIIPNQHVKYPQTDLQFKGTLREYQIPVVKEAWNQLEKFGTTTLGLYPGFGKTILGAQLASRARLLTVILVHREILADQWKKTFTDNTNAKVWIVGEKHPPSNCDVIICMETRYEAIPNEMRDMCGMLIIDEAHAFCTRSRASAILAFHPKFIIIESASLERKDGMHSMIYAVAGTHSILRQSDKPFSVYKIITNVIPERTKNRMGDVDYCKLQQSTLLDIRRNNIIIDMIKRNLNFKILVLTSLRDHAMLLYNNLNELNVSCDFLCGKKRGYVDSNVLIGTISKIGTGFDPATSCPTYDGSPFDLLFVVSSIKEDDMLIQNIGRVFRSDFPIVMHFVDNDPIYQNHWRKASKWYTKRNGSIVEFNCPNILKDQEDANKKAQEQADQKREDSVSQNWINEKVGKLKLNINKSI